MSEVARNLKRQFQQTSVTPRDVNMENASSLTVYSNQRVIPATQQTHRGVAEFLGGISQLVTDRYRQRVLDRATQDAVTGEVSEEFQNNQLYQETVATSRGRAQGIKAATQAQAQFDRAFLESLDNGSELSVEEYVGTTFAPLLETPEAQSSAYRSSLLALQQNTVERLSERAAGLSAQQQLAKANETALDIIDTTLDNAASSEDIEMASVMLDQTLEELGMTQKDKRGLMLQGYLGQIERATDPERVEMLNTKIQNWLKKEDRGLLRREADEIKAIVEAANSRIQTAEIEARKEQAKEYDDRFLNVKSRISLDPNSVSISELSNLREQNLLGITDAENRNRYIQLRDALTASYSRMADETRKAAEEAEELRAIQAAITDSANNPLAFSQLTADQKKRLPEVLDSDWMMAVMSPRVDSITNELLPPAYDVVNRYIEDPSPENEQALALVTNNLSSLVETSRLAGHDPTILKEMMGDFQPNDPRFRAGAALFENLQSSVGLFDIGLSQAAMGRYAAFNQMVRWMPPEQVIEVMSNRDNVLDMPSARRVMFSGDVVKDSKKADILDRLNRGEDSAPSNQQVVMQNVLDLAAQMYRYDQSDPEATINKAAEIVAKNSVVLDGYMFSSREMPQQFAALYNDKDQTFRRSIPVTVLDITGITLPEGWALRPLSTAGRAGLLTIIDPDNGGFPIINSQTGRPIVINPTDLVSDYLKALPEQQKEAAIERIREARANQGKSWQQKYSGTDLTRSLGGAL